MKQDPKPSDESGWFDRKENVRKVLLGLFVACGFFVALDLVFRITGFDKHPYFEFERWPGFYGVYGFLAATLLVLGGRFVLRPLVRRDEDYYERQEKEEGDA